MTDPSPAPLPAGHSLTPRQAATASGRAKAQYVRSLFDRIAPEYDRVNLIISLGQTSLWRRLVLREIELRAGMRALDIGCGTGVMARRLKRRAPDAHVTGMDLSGRMLDEARRLDPHGTYFQGDVCLLPVRDDSVDAVTTVYTTRNFQDKPAAFAEMLRVLKPGGKLLILDTFPPEGPRWWRAFHRFWLQQAIPRLAALLFRDDAYTYLGESILQHLRVREAADLLVSLGAQIDSIRSFSLGAAACIIARKR